MNFKMNNLNEYFKLIITNVQLQLFGNYGFCFKKCYNKQIEKEIKANI